MAIINVPSTLFYTTWTPTLGAAGSMTWTPTTVNQADYWTSGNIVYFIVDATGTTGGTASNALTFTLPITPSGAIQVYGMALWDGFNGIGVWSTNSGTTVNVFKGDNTNYSLGAGRYIKVAGFYKR